MYMHIFIVFHYGLSQNIDYINSSLGYSRAVLFIHSPYSSLYLLIPTSQSICLALHLPFGNHKSVLYVCDSVSSL